MAMTRPLRLGVVGAGALAVRVLRHLALPDVTGSAVVTHICDPVAERARAVADSFAVPRWSRSIDELLDDPDIDAVTIASPIGLHHQQGLQAIRSGRHVHFNKTMATTAAQATELITEARAADVRIVASPGEMLRPHNQQTKRLIEDGAIGRVCWAVCGAAFGTYHLDEPERRQNGALSGVDPSWYFQKPGGGPLYDMTVYALHALTGILGSVRRVTAMSAVRMRHHEFLGRNIETGADDNSLLLLDFGDGLFAFAYGTAAGMLMDDNVFDLRGRYFGTAGSIAGLLLDGRPFDYPGRELAVQAGDAVEGNQWLLPHVSEAHRNLSEQHVFEDVMQLVDWVRDGVPSPVTAEHARHVIEIIEAAYRAAETGSTQVLETVVGGLAATPLE